MQNTSTAKDRSISIFGFNFKFEAYAQGVTFALVTALSWSILAIALKVALQYTPSETLAWFRMSIATGVLSTYFLIRKPSSFRILKALPPIGIIAGLCLAANYWGFMEGIRLTTASQAQVMIQLGPLCLALVGILYFKETPTWVQAVGFTSAAFGLFLFFWDQMGQAVHQLEAFQWGSLWLVMAALTWTLFASLQKILSKTWKPQEINLLIYLVSAIALFPAAELNVMSDWTIPVWILMILCGLNTVVAYGCLGEALKRIPASHVSLIISANPLITLSLIALVTSMGVSWLNPEPVGASGYFGAFLVVTGLILTLHKKTKVKI